MLTLLNCMSTSARPFTWDSGGNNSKYEIAENWDTNTAPTSSGEGVVNLFFEDGGTTTYDSMTGTHHVDTMVVSHGSVFNISGGALEPRKSGNVVRTYIGAEGDGATVNQSGGRMGIGHIMKIGNKRASGVYNLSGGELSVFRGGNSLMGAPGYFSISLSSESRTAELIISGGSLDTRCGVEIGTNGTFQVLGVDTSKIDIGGTQDRDPGSWYQQGTLSCSIGSKGLTKIHIFDGTSSESFATFLAGSTLDLSFHETEPYFGTWTILELEGEDIVDEGLALSAATSKDPNWRFTIDNSGPNGVLKVTYSHTAEIPEPLSFVLIFGIVGSLTLACRRRK